ncbi:MAG: hypothetical protein HY746_02455 [Elusimicrobia bacterium]|nr:hypothetical protein [Elusimicrobiota bacterium]
MEEQDYLLDSKIRFHDRHRFEIKLDIDLAAGRKSSYQVESWFFIPRALNIGPHTYSKEHFYNSSQRYIRFKTPKISLSKLADSATKISPLNRISQELPDMLAGARKPGSIATVYNEFKLLGCIIRGEIRDYAGYFLDELKSVSENSVKDGAKCSFLEESAGNFVRDLNLIIEKIKSIRQTQSNPAVPQKIKEAFSFFDEFFSLIAEEYLTLMAQAVEKSPLNEKLAAIKNSLLEIVIAQNNYRKSMNYPSVSRDDRTREVLIYRRGVLKKFISSALYLKVEISEWESMLQFLFGVAAGLAMLFAILVTVYAQNRFAMNSAAFVAVVVLSYIFKDRLKDWLKLLFSRGMTRWFSDRKINILDQMSGGKIGFLKEAFSFVNPMALSPDISRIRNIDNITSIDEDGKPERVFKYEKKILLYPGKILRFHERRRDINDIMRFNIGDFIVHADDSEVDYPFADSQTREVRILKCPRVYHLNVVIKYIYSDPAGRQTVNYDRIRIVLNKEGIVRLEEVKAV